MLGPVDGRREVHRHLDGQDWRTCSSVDLLEGSKHKCSENPVTMEKRSLNGRSKSLGSMLAGLGHQDQVEKVKGAAIKKDGGTVQRFLKKLKNNLIKK